MTITESDLDEVLIRIGDEIDRYRASRPPVRLTDAAGEERGDREAHRLRRGAFVAVAASVLAVAGGWGIASFNRGSSGEDAVGSPSVPAGPEPGVLAPVVEPLLPDGFVVVRETSSVPFVVTALGPYGVRVDVRVGLDEAEIVRQQVGDTLVPAPAGEMTSNGSMVFTEAGDVVSVDTWYGHLAPGDDLSVSFAAVAQSDIARMAAGVAEALDDNVRDELAAVGSRVNDLATSKLRADIQDALVASTGGTLSTSGTADPGNFRVSVETPAATTLTLTAIRSSTTVEDGTTRPSPGAVTATAVVNGWIVQLVDVDSAAPAGVLTDADIDTVFSSIEPIFESWTNEVPTGPSCGSYTIRAGDSIASIAEQHDVTIEALDVANADLDSAILPGVVINLPCPDPSGVTPPSDPAAGPIVTAADNHGLPYLVFDPVPEGYTFSSAMSARHGKDFEPPALLLAWTRDDDAIVPITVGIVERVTPIAPPTGANLVATDTVSGWTRQSDGMTTAYLQPTDGPGYQLHSSDNDIPGNVLIDIVTGLAPDGTLTWQDQIPTGIMELARQDRDATMHSATYESAGGGVSIATYDSLPVNGLTLSPGTTVTPDLSISGMSGFALTIPIGDGTTERVLYWSSGDGPVFSISATGTDLGVDELIAIADQARPASPDEEAEFRQR